MEVLLVRHGESADNAQKRIQGWSGSGLTDRGRAEAAAVAEYLASQSISRLYSSDLRRASETAAVIGRRLGLEVEASACFREMKLGPWEGRIMREVEEEDPRGIWQWRYDGRRPAHPGIEPVGAVLARVLSGLERLRIAGEAMGVRRAAIVTHGGVLSITLTHLLGLDCVRIWQMPTVNGSLSRLVHDRGAWRASSWNETAHLPPRPEGMNTI